MSGNDDLLYILEAHGREFLNSFSQPQSGGKKRKRRELEESRFDWEKSDEWQGFGTVTARDAASDNADLGGKVNGNDHAFPSESTSTRAPAVVIFSESKLGSTSTLRSTKAHGSSFMAAKVSKSRLDSTPVEATLDSDDGDEGETSNIQNDAALRRLIHTKLLSGSLNPDLELTAAQRKKALSGRIVELAGGARLGKGEKLVREKERNRAAKHIRDGMADKQAQRRDKQLSEAKNIGNYHPTIKKLFEDPSELSARKREKGLRMGVGKFSGGMLKLSREEVDSVNAVGRSSRGRPSNNSSRGRGRGRGMRSRTTT
ncbi:hypothetical protein HETIRDRAFT_381876 [Heterobasidion irregulare TC 32-1]|uniref:Uncharacterized protein n=1 Tax=Heterobasidion irregulare (strain TC 32-1) TaxID=747525 RepID=W4KF83_HETIT|nr:uncharacterized protein HETIRDRAFT_381876 [Heterobasidion irregulare TC 32-1]ETW84379.1 hypothetical protein HETIRDRAFT_381876 [Heterobasidion irregulare TC 32-1]